MKNDNSKNRFALTPRGWLSRVSIARDQENRRAGAVSATERLTPPGVNRCPAHNYLGKSEKERTEI